jgi:hypothetical protein
MTQAMSNISGSLSRDCDQHCLLGCGRTSSTFRRKVLPTCSGCMLSMSSTLNTEQGQYCTYIFSKQRKTARLHGIISLHSHRRGNLESNKTLGRSGLRLLTARYRVRCRAISRAILGVPSGIAAGPSFRVPSISPCSTLVYDSPP